REWSRTAWSQVGRLLNHAERVLVHDVLADRAPLARLGTAAADPAVAHVLIHAPQRHAFGRVHSVAAEHEREALHRIAAAGLVAGLGAEVVVVKARLGGLTGRLHATVLTRGQNVGVAHRAHDR